MRLLFAFSLFIPGCFGQVPKPLRYSSEVGSFLSTTGQTPFWLRANQFGIVPVETARLTVRQGLHVDYHGRPVTKLDSLRAANRRIDWGWGAEAVFNAGHDYRLLIPQAYVKVRMGAFELWGGRRRERVGLGDSLLSSGSFSHSGNALPLLKVQMSLPDFTPRRGLIGIRGFYAHGWFEEDRFVQNTLLHQKTLYLRFGKPHWRLKLYGGVNHQVMWGGSTERLPSSRIKNGQLPATFADYIDVVTASSLGNRTNVDTNRVSLFDRENRIGNHLGSVDLGFEYITRRFSLFAYRQSIYEDGSLAYLINIGDGLNGLRIRNRRPLNPEGWQIQDVLLEYLYTQSQGGAVFADDPALRGRDNYFNHSQYQDGWSRYGLTLGTPFITPSGDARADLPRYGFTNNNRVAVMHIGVLGQALDFLRFMIKASYSENLGTYEVPFARTLHQFSASLNLMAPLYILNGVTGTAAVAGDWGELYPNRLGVYIGIRKEGQTRKR